MAREYAICEQRPAHFNNSFNNCLIPLPLETLKLPDPLDFGQQNGKAESAVMLTLLKSKGCGTKLREEQVVLYYGGGTPDYQVNFRNYEHHHDQIWLRLVPLDELGSRIYHGW